MEENLHKDSLEEYFNKSLKDLEGEPSADFWDRIEPSIPEKPEKEKPVFIWSKIMAAASIIIILGLTTWAYKQSILLNNLNYQVEEQKQQLDSLNKIKKQNKEVNKNVLNNNLKDNQISLNNDLKIKEEKVTMSNFDFYKNNSNEILDQKVLKNKELSKNEFTNSIDVYDLESLQQTEEKKYLHSNANFSVDPNINFEENLAVSPILNLDKQNPLIIGSNSNPNIKPISINGPEINQNNSESPLQSLGVSEIRKLPIIKSPLISQKELQTNIPPEVINGINPLIAALNLPNKNHSKWQLAVEFSPTNSSKLTSFNKKNEANPGPVTSPPTGFNEPPKTFGNCRKNGKHCKDSPYEKTVLNLGIGLKSFYSIHPKFAVYSGFQLSKSKFEIGGKFPLIYSAANEEIEPDGTSTFNYKYELATSTGNVEYELLLKNKNEGSTPTINEGDSIFLTFNSLHKKTNLRIPVGLEFRHGNGPIQFAASAGLGLKYTFSSKQNLKSAVALDDRFEAIRFSSKEKSSSTIPNLKFDLELSTGIIYKLNSRISASIQPAFKIDLTNTFKNKDFKVKEYSLGLNADIRINL